MSREAEKLVEEFSEDLATILETFIEETQDAKVVIARIETEMGRLKDDITSLNKTIIHGNGQPPLITRIAVVEEKIAEVKAKIESMEAESAEEKKMRWEFIIAAVPGILALLTGGML
jgi:50S ribosomal subunit-associated GTPase HflX|tara:strand:+ start:526 stop:876 length:351 start_codon:yes stop_codon:yes gene_type:complete